MKKLLGTLALVLLSGSLASIPGQVDRIKKVRNALPNRYIVVLNDKLLTKAVSEHAQELAAAHNAKIRFLYEYAIKGFAASMDEAAAMALSEDPLVNWVEEDGLVSARGTQNPTPSWGLDRIDQLNLPLDGVYNYSFTGNGENVAVIDTGIRPTHQDFGGRAHIGADFVGDGQNGIDCNGHGTHVAGTIGGTSYGVAKNVTLWAVRVLGCDGTGATSTIIAGVNWVTQNCYTDNIGVVNMSIGTIGGPSDALDSAVGNSSANCGGIFYVAAAGNNNVDATNSSPARGANFTVGASDMTDTRASLSNYGSKLAWFAPGVNITSDWYTSDTATAVDSGTSMAAPHAAGVLAMQLEAYWTWGTNSGSPQPAGSICEIVNSSLWSGGAAISNPGPGTTAHLIFSGNVGAADPDKASCKSQGPGWSWNGATCTCVCTIPHDGC